MEREKYGSKKDLTKHIPTTNLKKVLQDCIRLSKYIFFDKKGLFSFEAKR
jgi:hypothetical protein